MKMSRSSPRRASTLLLLPPLDGEGWGGVASRHFQFIQRLPNRIHDRANVFVEFLVSKTEDVEAARGEPGRTPLVVLDGCRIAMLWAVELDDEFVCEANNINDVCADRGLAMKLPSAQLLSAKEVP